jgi:hypothetical protein
MSLLRNATKQELLAAGLLVIGNCIVPGCDFPVARHRDEHALTIINTSTQQVLLKERFPVS